MSRSPHGFTRSLPLFLAVGATLIALSAGTTRGWADSDPKHEAWNWSGTLAAGRTLEINGINGEIVAEPGTGDQVVVTADKHARRHDPAEVQIKVVQDSDGITICAVYPKASSPCEKDHWGGGTNNSDVAVDFHVKVPAGVAFNANTVNGRVAAHGLTGTLRAHTVNGACDISTLGTGEATTVNGSVKATIGRLERGKDLSFKTVNGSITLGLPEGVDAELEGSTVNGQIESDFPVTITGKWGPRHMNATLGKGGTQISASTVNGSIHLARNDAR
jgi:hypothetical protein